MEALDKSGCIRGMVGYDRWTPNAVEMHCAVDHPAAWLSLLGPGLQYPFEQAFGRGVGLAIAQVNDDNLSCKKFLHRMGWTMVHRTRGGYTPDVDVLVFEMRREWWQSMRAAGRNQGRVS